MTELSSTFVDIEVVLICIEEWRAWTLINQNRVHENYDRNASYHLT